jgi:hypothetical protein
MVALILAAALATTQETDRPVLVIATAAGPSTAGGEIGLYNDAGRLEYGVSALVTGGSSSWAGGLLAARWTVLPESRFNPFVGLGAGIFSAQRSGVDLGVQPTAAAEAGVRYWRLFAGARLLVPLSTRTAGRDQPGFGDPALLATLGLRL